MKKARSLLTVFFAMLIIFSSVLFIHAEDMVSQDGINLFVTTDKDEYKVSDRIAVTVTVENDSPDELEGVCVDIILPKEIESEDSTQILDLTVEPDSSYEAEISAGLSDKYKGTSSVNKGDEKNPENSAPETPSDEKKNEESRSVYGKYGHYIIIGIGAVVAAAAVTFIVFLVKRSKGTRMLSVLLCLSLVLPAFCAMNVNGAKTEDLSLLAEAAFTVASKEYTVKAQVNYNVTLGEDCTVSFETGEGSDVESVIVESGEKLPVVASPEREGFMFAGWFCDAELQTPFDSERPVYRSCTLHASWIDLSDTTDTDGDGLIDVLEEYFGSDKEKEDTDGDGLSDPMEALELSLDPTLKDTDDDSVDDGDEDADGDGITNLDEIEMGTNLLVSDTDSDGLADGEEGDYETSPVDFDTDGDGASDGLEVQLGTDPLDPQTSFNVVSSANSDDTVKASVAVDLSGSQVGTLHVDAYENDLFFPEDMPGYMGMAYDFSVDGEFDRAVISFEFDSSVVNPESVPTIYYFNEEEQTLEALETTLSGNVASATVTHFSKYILVDRTVYEQSFSWVDVWEDTDYSGVEIVLVVDDSGSMEWNDEYDQRLTVASTMVDDLPKDSRIGIVKFENYVTMLTPSLLTDKEQAKAYLTDYYFDSDGSTYMYTAIGQALSLYESPESDILKVMVVLSDGDAHDTEYHNSVISNATDIGVKIYTVALGDSSSYFYSYLQPLAHSTGGEFYYADDADQLAAIYEDISDKIDITTDSDEDGISDYYEEHLVSFTGVKLALDKNNVDSDGDGIHDGDEVVMVQIQDDTGKKMLVTGRYVLGDPSTVDADGDGLIDPDDKRPFTWDVCDRDLVICSNLIYSDLFRDTSNYNLDSLSDSEIASLDEALYKTGSVEELRGWSLLFRYEISYSLGYEGGLCYGIFRKDDNLVVAVRGSEGDWYWSSDWDNNFLTYPWTTDNDTETIMSRICSDVNAFMRPGDKLYITGHSRGGMLAQRAAVSFVEKGQADKITRVSYFNGIGVVFAKGLWGRGREWYDSLESISSKVTRHYVKGDLVGDHLGVHVTDGISYNLTQVAEDNSDSSPKHRLCNFTVYMMPERYDRLKESQK